MVRFRPRLAAFIGHPDYPRRLQITWSYGGDDEGSGMPDREDGIAMEEMEDSLVRAMEASRAGSLAFVFTHRGAREWHFYVAEAANLDAIINEALADSPGLPIELMIADDPQWSELAGLLDSVKARGAHDA